MPSQNVGNSSIKFDVGAFRARLVDGGARPNQFYINIGTTGVILPNSQILSDATYLATAATMPGSIVQDAPVMYRGRVVHLGGERNYNPWTINILNDNDYGLRDYMESWSNMVNNRVDNSGYINPTDYMADLSAVLLDRNSKTRRTYNLANAFPLDVSEVQLDFGANNQVSQFSVTFVYQDFSITNGSGADTAS